MAKEAFPAPMTGAWLKSVRAQHAKRSQRWVAQHVQARYGLVTDPSRLHKIEAGRYPSPPILLALCRLYEIDVRDVVARYWKEKVGAAARNATFLASTEAAMDPKEAEEGYYRMLAEGSAVPKAPDDRYTDESAIAKGAKVPDRELLERLIGVWKALDEVGRNEVFNHAVSLIPKAEAALRSKAAGER